MVQIVVEPTNRFVNYLGTPVRVFTGKTVAGTRIEMLVLEVGILKGHNHHDLDDVLSPVRLSIADIPEEMIDEY